MRRTTKRVISLEEFASFQAKLDDGHRLTAELLNQILTMHGFCKVHRPKADILEALRSVPLVSPFRSTLELGAAPASLTTDELAMHAADLNWNECPMGSVSSLTLGVACEEQAVATPGGLRLAPPCSSPPYHDSNKKRKHTKRLRVAKLHGNSSRSMGDDSLTPSL